ncbi:MAG: hypothetical protein ACRD0K_07710 [Egibacteraceae bacterium]
MIVDRNFLSSLAYAYSIRSQGAALLRERVWWCRRNLASGRFEHPRVYCVFDCPVPVSLGRRGIVASGGHPWTEHAPLCELRRFYARLGDTLSGLDPILSCSSDTAVILLAGQDPLDANLRRVRQALMATAV